MGWGIIFYLKVLKRLVQGPELYNPPQPPYAPSAGILLIATVVNLAFT